MFLQRAWGVFVRSLRCDQPFERVDVLEGRIRVLERGRWLIRKIPEVGCLTTRWCRGWPSDG
ncbi:MAG: hypothetical protein DRH11_08640 [Deltaproteobacteria bacterium]|nr:MAG: hypothetical protein DRH11_08640 [Deltaproteobacteria bacterium]